MKKADKKNNQKSKVSIGDLVEKNPKKNEDPSISSESNEASPDGLPILPKRNTGKEANRFFRWAILVVLGFCMVLGITYIVTFFLLVRGEEVTKVPDIIGLELVDGLVELQERELYPKVQLRYTSNPQDKGLIVEQTPIAGSDVRAGRRINIVVSNGAVVDRVENYVGQQLSEVRLYLMTLFANYRPLLRIKEPIIYIFDEAPAGTILQQIPEEGTEISSLTDLELVVSRGLVGETFSVLDYIGQTYLDALAILSLNDIPFTISFIESENTQNQGKIISQSPLSGSSIEVGESIQLHSVFPEVPAGYEFDVIRYTLPDYPGPVDLQLVAENEMGVETVLFKTKTTGGQITIPYMEKPGTVLTVYIDDQPRPSITVFASEQ